MCKIQKSIFFELGAFWVDWAIIILYTYSLIITKYTIPVNIFGSLKVFFVDKKKAVFYSIAFLSFINIAIFPKKFFNAGIVLNYWGLVYWRAV